MSLIAGKSKKAKRVRPEDGTYVARIAQVVDLGRQQQYDYRTGEAREWDDGGMMVKPEAWVTFELPTETHEFKEGEGEMPLWVSKRYTVSSHAKAAMSGLIKAAGGKEGDLGSVLGSSVMVTVGSTKSGNAKIESVSAPMKGMEVPDLQKDPIVFSLDDPDEGVFSSLPPFIQDLIKNSEGFTPFTSTPATEETDEDLPF